MLNHSTCPRSLMSSPSIRSQRAASSAISSSFCAHSSRSASTVKRLEAVDRLVQEAVEDFDRIQIIKGWVDANGERRERIFDAAVPDRRSISPDGRRRSARPVLAVRVPRVEEVDACAGVVGHS